MPSCNIGWVLFWILYALKVFLIENINKDGQNQQSKEPTLAYEFDSLTKN